MATAVRISSFWKLIISIAVCEAVGITSALVSNTDNYQWFETLLKPTWNPPAYLFGPVWSILYLLMGIAFWFVWKADIPFVQKRKAIAIFAVQLIFNFCWSLLFFKFHSPFYALIDIIIMIITITLTMFNFSSINRKAVYLLVPYILWVSFAALLNFTIWIMN
jgi:tryptophan-rich sensory protein